MQVKLVDSMGGDLRVANAAYASFGNFVTEFGPKEAGVLQYMMDHHHGTPFEKTVFEFYVETSIAIMRELQRHRHASWNEVSTRWVKMQPNFEYPRMRRQIGKASRKTFEFFKETDRAKNLMLQEKMEHMYEDAYSNYQELLDDGLAPECARNVLPLGLRSSGLVTINFRSLMNVMSLRLPNDALEEIRPIAQAMMDYAHEVTPVSTEAWEKAQRPNGDAFHECDDTCILVEPAA